MTQSEETLLKTIGEELRSLKTLIIIYKNKEVKTIGNVKNIEILNGENERYMNFYEYSLYGYTCSEYGWWKKTIILSDVKKIVYCGVTIWEADE